jgi:hypothetical protein
MDDQHPWIGSERSTRQAQCTGRRADGQRCGRWPTDGATVCQKHGAGAPQVAAKAAVRAEIERWGLGAADVDPGRTLLRLISQSAARAQRYAGELEGLAAQSPDLRSALIGDSYGEFGKIGEYARGLVRLEAEERDRLARFCGIAINAGLMERLVVADERRAAQLATMLRRCWATPVCTSPSSSRPRSRRRSVATSNRLDHQLSRE